MADTKKVVMIASMVICLLLVVTVIVDQKLRGSAGNALDKPKEQDAAQKTAEGEADKVVADTSQEAAGSAAEDAGEGGFGIFDITSIPANATLFLNDIEKGMTPWIDSVPVGVYAVKVVKEGYADYHKTNVTIFNGKTRKFTALLALPKAPAAGDVAGEAGEEETGEENSAGSAAANGIKFTSEPSGAEIKINGAVKGATPITLELAEGQYTLKYTTAGYLSYTAYLYVNANGDVTNVDEDFFGASAGVAEEGSAIVHLVMVKS